MREGGVRESDRGIQSNIISMREREQEMEWDTKIE